MVIVGLTGSIGMGKSETARMFRELGVRVYDADAAVHRIYEAGGPAVAPLEAAFPGVSDENGVNRDELSKHVLDNPDAMKKLESIVHPLVAQEQINFLRDAAAAGEEIVVVDVPLLYETGGEARVDCVVVVSAPYELQKQRVLERPGMTAEKFAAIVAKQVPDAEKRDRADFIVESDKGLDAAFAQVKAMLPKLKACQARVWAQTEARLRAAEKEA